MTRHRHSEPNGGSERPAECHSEPNRGRRPMSLPLLDRALAVVPQVT